MESVSAWSVVTRLGPRWSQMVPEAGRRSTRLRPPPDVGRPPAERQSLAVYSAASLGQLCAVTVLLCVRSNPVSPVMACHSVVERSSCDRPVDTTQLSNQTSHR